MYIFWGLKTTDAQCTLGSLSIREVLKVQHVGITNKKLQNLATGLAGTAYQNPGRNAGRAGTITIFSNDFLF
jgi:hypothetical protein